MRKTILAFAICAVLSVSVLSQTPSRTPPDDGEVVKITTTLIQLDVSVTDKKGNPVTDLRQDEVEIFENGKKQEITGFRFVSARRPAKVDAKPNEAGVPVPDAVRPASPEKVRRTIALVVDDLSLSFESTHFVRRALRNFVDTQMQEGDLVAIIRTEGGIGALQQFTSNKQQLYAAIEKVRWNLRGRARVGAFLPIDGNAPEIQTNPDDQIINEEDNIDEWREDVFATGTLGAMNYIVRGMRDLPGRKSVMLISDGFLLFRKNSRGLVESTRSLPAIERLVDLANRSSVVVYTTDARGLQTANFTAADNVGGQEGVFVNRTLSDRRFELEQSQDALIFLAENTGGLSYRNTNSIGRAIGGMLDDQSYYLVGYEPDDEVFDAEKRKFNKISIKVSRPDTEVRYRSGFFGVTDEQAAGTAKNLNAEEKILNAITSPFAVNDIGLSLHTVFRGATKKELFVGSFIHIDLKDLTFTSDQNGKHKAAFDLLIMSFGDNGVPLESTGKTVTLYLEDAQYETLLKEGLIYTLDFPVKKPGGYLLRTAIRDHSSDKLGSANQFVLVPNPSKQFVLSGIVVDNVSYDQWNSVNAGTGPTFAAVGSEAGGALNSMTDTALREFKQGSVLIFGLEAYSAKRKRGEAARLTVRTRLVKDRKVVYEGPEMKVEHDPRANEDAVPISGAMNLPETLAKGEYLLQIIVTDLNAGKNGSASAVVDFEIVE